MASVLLIYPKPDYDKQARFGFSLNLLYLSSIIKSFGHTINGYLDYSLERYSDEYINQLISKSDFIIIDIDSFSLKRSTNVNSAELLTEMIKKKYPIKKIIAIGYDIDLFPRNVDYADYTISSDKIEEDVVHIINKNNQINYFSNNFDQLQFPDRSILSEYINHGGTLSHTDNLKKSTIIQTSRGCMNSCTFCQRQGWHKKYQVHSIEYVVTEFKYLKENNYINIWVSDDNFTFNLDRAKGILNLLIKEGVSQNMKISCSSWSKIDKEFLELAKEANVSIISFGIESANADILKFYNKNIDLKHVIDIITFADTIGLYTVGNFIIGAPMETEETIKNTFDYALQTPFDQVNVKILDYMAGSIIYNNLPDNIKNNQRHLFGCKENNLNNFHLSELKGRIDSFKTDFISSRKGKMTSKIKLYGTPYQLR